MIDILPAILPKNFADLQEHLEKFHDTPTVVQIDVVDGVFAPNTTWPYTDAEFRHPQAKELRFQYDLMVDHPVDGLQRFIEADTAGIVIHAQSVGALEALQWLRSNVQDKQTFSIGIAVLPHSSTSILEAFAGLYDFVQVMGIAKVGFQGQPFTQETHTLIENIRTLYPTVPIQVDGGVTQKNAQLLVKNGATRLVVGSAIFAAPDPKEMFRALYTEVNA